MSHLHLPTRVAFIIAFLFFPNNRLEKLTPYRRLYAIHVVNLIVKFEIVVHIVRSDNFDPHPALTEKFYLLDTLPSQYSCDVAQQWRWRSEINRR